MLMKTVIIQDCVHTLLRRRRGGWEECEHTRLEGISDVLKLFNGKINRQAKLDVTQLV